MQKICFMVMPFGVKETGLKTGGPSKVDFDQLWNKVYEPAIKALGYSPVRADSELGSLIINEMILSLVASDLVLADASIQNANVYYEIGVRHAASKTGCVIVQADWTRAAFDIEQMRAIRFPLDTCDISDKQAKEIRALLEANFENYAIKASPVYEVVPEMVCTFAEDNHKDNRVERFKKLEAQITSLNKLMASINNVRAMANYDTQKANKAREVLKTLEDYPGKVTDKVTLDVMYMLRDCALWPEVIKLIDGVSEELKIHPEIQEQKLLALSETEGAKEAIGFLTALIDQYGPSSERYGLLGGRYKRLYREAKQNQQEKAAKNYLSKAIRAYKLGMQQDLNDYYPSCNLPQLLKARNRRGDWEQAKAIACVVVAACERVKAQSSDDPYLLPTLLGAAFDSENSQEATRLIEEMSDEMLQQFVLNNTLPDLEERANQARSDSVREELQELILQLKDMQGE